MDDGDGFVSDGSDRPGFAQEVQGIIGVEAALEVEGQMQVQQGNWWHWVQMVAFFFEGQLPGGVWGQVGGATDVVLIMPVDLGLEQGVGVFVVGDFFIGQKGDEPVLEGAEAAFDFTFGGGVWSHTMGRAQGRKGALELGMGIQAVGGGGMAKESQAIRVKAGGQPVFFQEGAEMGEVRPSGIAGSKDSAQDFPGVVIERENEAGIVFIGPPTVGRAVVLPEIANGSTLPAAAGFGAAFGGWNQEREVLANISGHCGAGAMEIEFAGQFIGQQGEIKRAAVWQEGGKESVCILGPGFLVVAARSRGGKPGLVTEPLMAQPIELGGTDMQTFRSRACIELAGIKGGQNFLNEQRRNAMSKLFLFIASQNMVDPQAQKVFRMGLSLSRIQRAGKTAPVSTGAVVEPLN